MKFKPLNSKLIFILILFSSLFCMAKSSLAADHYIRQGATGSANGSDWTNAWTDIPSASALIRGDTYYFADGNYAKTGYTFNKALNGTSLITFKKATFSYHGTDNGWSASFGDGIATFGSGIVNTGSIALWVTTGYFVLDGTTGGGPGSWESGFGFVITTSNVPDVRAIRIMDYGGDDVYNVTIRHCELGGPFVAGISTGIYAFGAKSYNTTIEYNWIHGHGEGLIRWYNANNALIQYNALTTNPPAEPAHHGSGATFWGNSNTVTVRFNRFKDIRGSGWLGLYTGTHTDHYYHGNIFYTTDGAYDQANGVIYNADSVTTTKINWNIYNNTFYNIGTLPLVACYADVSTPCNTSIGSSKNNLAYLSNGSMSYGFAYENNITASSNPFLNLSSVDFHLLSNTTSGTNLGSSYNTDMDGITRSTWSRGAYEYVQPGGRDTTPPAAPRNVKVN